MTDRGCVSVSTSCRTHDLSGRCTSCYKGYKLENSFCVLSDLNNQPPIDLGCASWDWDNQICLQCSNRFVLTSNGCTPVSDNCRTFNSAGDCTLCYKGYEVSQG